MKVQLPYTTFKGICDDMSEKIETKARTLSLTPVLVAVARGGLTAAHRIAYNLSLPIEVFCPKTGIGPICTLGQDCTGKALFFIEDLIAKGRTYAVITTYMEAEHPGVPWQMCPVLVDADYARTQSLPEIFGFVSSSWIVFPYEDFNRTVEKDWGLFRNGTSENSKGNRS